MDVLLAKDGKDENSSTELDVPVLIGVLTYDSAFGTQGECVTDGYDRHLPNLLRRNN